MKNKSNPNELDGTSNDSVVMTLKQAAQRLACSRRFLEMRVNEGRLRVVRFSPRCIRVRPSDLRDFIENHAV